MGWTSTLTWALARHLDVIIYIFIVSHTCNFCTIWKRKRRVVLGHWTVAVQTANVASCNKFITYGPALGAAGRTAGQAKLEVHCCCVTRPSHDVPTDAEGNEGSPATVRACMSCEAACICGFFVCKRDKLTTDRRRRTLEPGPLTLEYSPIPSTPPPVSVSPADLQGWKRPEPGSDGRADWVTRDKH